METDFLPLYGTDYIEFYVVNAKQAAHYYKTAFGFQGIAYVGPKYLTDDNGKLGISGIRLYGDTVHLFIERHDYHGVFMPGYRV
jgi:hypothetical protein